MESWDFEMLGGVRVRCGTQSLDDPVGKKPGALLARLRRQLEPDGILPGSVLVADRSQVGLAAGHQSDVAAFWAPKKGCRYRTFFLCRL